MWTRLLPLDATELYTALLGVERADPLDTGRYTCQVSDWGYQQCQSVYLEVMQPPRVMVYPLSLTVEKVKAICVYCLKSMEFNIDFLEDMKSFKGK